MTTTETRIVHDTGNGKAIVCVVEYGSRYHAVASRIVHQINPSFRVILIEVQNFNEETWQERADQLGAVLQSARIRFACIVALGEVGALVQHLYLALPRSVRSLVLLDATTRPHPSFWTRFIGTIEAQLPIGLPFRSTDSVFNGQPFLQRFRCPVLIISTSAASQYQRSQAQILLDTLPTAWKESIPWEHCTDIVPSLINEFQGVAAKSPQRNRTTDAATETTAGISTRS